ncbi:hypothetical protein HYPSUDRAFT_144043 [Hypholoma sublateritium FD-334 SS-4]|uniref:Thioredoxin domain-containing protein n=1 Tax=Hypholoma sublateritium (strain FD-334 SS-4) TaxID=945553 RepID=A0A0D2PGJ1_HYPSF|nr:hypothetical protein HYPSUDRAFT_144043 [Hypholoma sublateritium FD-334 SS-4]
MNDPHSIPDAQSISEAAELEVFGAEGEKVKFGDLIEDRKTIVVFIRHFFCGFCQTYVGQLTSTVSKESLDRENVQIIVIGCGDWNPIATYKELTMFRGPIYADPSRTLYHTLGMGIENLDGTPKGEMRKSYLTQGVVKNALQSIWRGPLKNPSLIGKQGNLSQLGGDFIFGPGNTCSFASRMRHTEDHMEIKDLMKEADVPFLSPNHSW